MDPRLEDQAYRDLASFLTKKLRHVVTHSEARNIYDVWVVHDELLIADDGSRSLLSWSPDRGWRVMDLINWGHR